MRRSRKAFTLVELLLATGVLAASMVTVFGLITWTRRMATEGAKRELAQTVAADTMARLAGEPFDRLAQKYGAGTSGQSDPRRDPVLAGALAHMANEPGAPALDVRADFRPLPQGPGFLQVAVTYPTHGDETDTVVVSRLLPTPALSSTSLESGPKSLVQRAAAPLATEDATPATRANDQLYFSLLKRIPTSGAAAFLDFAMSVDRRDHKYDRDWSKLSSTALEEEELWKRIEDELSDATVPDGVYGLTEDRFVRGGHRVTLWTLRDMNEREYFLLKTGEGDADGAVKLGAQTARELGSWAIAALVGQDAERPREPASAQVTATTKRLFLAHDRFDAEGRRQPFARRMGLFSAGEDMDPFAVSRSLTAFLPKAAKLAGLALQPRAVAAAKADERW